jgi:secreted trypsin-like serine protease
VADPGDPSVVAIFAHPPGVNSGSICTGTVIGPFTVLTAAHCVSPEIVGAGQVFEVLTGPTLVLPGLPVSSTTFHPAWVSSNPFGGHDVGIVHLASPTTLPAIPIDSDPSIFALATRIVGYGSNTHANTGVGTKRTATTVPVAASATIVQIGNTSTQTCHGDSGGPAFQVLNGVETIIGITSFGSDASAGNVCLGGGFSSRVDADFAYILANTF